MLDKEDRLVPIGYAVLVIYNIFTIPSLFEWSISESFDKFYDNNFGLLTLLEFVVLAALFVNMIILFDKFSKNKGRIHLLITSLCLIGFFLKIIFYFMQNFKDV